MTTKPLGPAARARGVQAITPAVERPGPHPLICDECGHHALHHALTTHSCGRCPCAAYKPAPAHEPPGASEPGICDECGHYDVHHQRPGPGCSGDCMCRAYRNAAEGVALRPSPSAIGKRGPYSPTARASWSPSPASPARSTN